MLFKIFVMIFNLIFAAGSGVITGCGLYRLKERSF